MKTTALWQCPKCKIVYGASGKCALCSSKLNEVVAIRIEDIRKELSTLFQPVIDIITKDLLLMAGIGFLIASNIVRRK